MKLNTLTKLVKWFSAISLAGAASSLVGVPMDINYSGSLADDTGALLDGDYEFKFAIAPEVPADETEIYWSNAPWDAVAGMPDSSLTVSVSLGVFTTVLEDVDTTALNNPDLTLHIWLSDAPDGTFEYLGAQPINSVPYALIAGMAESVDGGAITGAIDGSLLTGEIDGGLLTMGSIDEDALGNITISVPGYEGTIDGNGNGIPGEPEDVEISMASIMRSISENSVVDMVDLPGRSNLEVFLRLNVPVGAGGSGVFNDPFPIAHVYETNGGLTPTLDILADDGTVITGAAGDPIPGLTFVNVMEDVDGDGINEPRMEVRGTPTQEGTFMVNVRATNRWGQPFIETYAVQVSPVDIDPTERVRGYSQSQTSGNRNASVGPDLIPEVGGDDANFDVYGGDPTWFRFITDEPLADNIIVQWTVPDGTGGTATFQILGDEGRTFWVNSPGGTAPLGDGRGTSQGAIHLDDNPWEADVSHTGVYSASIVFDWGQTLAVGADSLDNIFEGFALPATAIQYGSGAGVNPLFDQFTDVDATNLGDETIVGQFFGFTPAPNSPFGLLNTAEAGEVDKYLQGEDPFDVLFAEGTAGSAYIRGTATTSWIQQKIQRVDGAGTVYQERGVNILEQDTNTGNVLEADPWLVMDGFGPLDGSGNLLGAAFPAIGAGLISDANNKRSTYSYPQDGSQLTFDAPVVPTRPVLGDDFDPTLTPAQEKSLYLNNGYLLVLYWVHVTNGFIDQIAPITAVFEVGDNINIVNDLLPRSQVAGYPTTIGGDFGTTNGRTFSGLLPDVVDNPTNKVAAPGVNNVGYIWTAFGGGSGFSFVNPALGNSINVPGSSMINSATTSDATADFRYELEVDSGYSSEDASDANVFVRSDIVIYDFFVQEIDLSLNRTDPGFIVFGDDTTQTITIDQGDDLMITLQAYVRPALFNTADDGAILPLGLQRTLDAQFFVVPDNTNIPVEITANIVRIDDDTVGIDGDADDNHVPGPIPNRVLVTWEVILENPLQAIAQTNVATGFIKAFVNSSVGGVTVNSVSTSTVDGNRIAPYGNGLNTVDGVLDTMVEMPLNPTVVGPGGGITLIVNP